MIITLMHTLSTIQFLVPARPILTAESECNIMPWLSRSTPGGNVEVWGTGYALAFGYDGAAAVLSDRGVDVDERHIHNGCNNLDPQKTSPRSVIQHSLVSPPRTSASTSGPRWNVIAGGAMSEMDTPELLAESAAFSGFARERRDPGSFEQIHATASVAPVQLDAVWKKCSRGRGLSWGEQ